MAETPEELEARLRREMAELQQRAKAREESTRAVAVARPPALPQPWMSPIGPVFNNADDFATWVQLAPNGGLRLGTNTGPFTGDLDAAFAQAEAEFENPHTTISFSSAVLIPNLRVAYRFRHMVGNLSERQVLFLQWVRAMEVFGIYDPQRGDAEGRAAELHRHYVGLMHLDKKPETEHFVIGAYGDSYEEKFKTYREEGLRRIVPSEHDLLQFLVAQVSRFVDFDGALGEMASRIVGTGGGWATSR